MYNDSHPLSIGTAPYPQMFVPPPRKPVLVFNHQKMFRGRQVVVKRRMSRESSPYCTPRATVKRVRSAKVEMDESTSTIQKRTIVISKQG